MQIQAALRASSAPSSAQLREMDGSAPCVSWPASRAASAGRLICGFPSSSLPAAAAASSRETPASSAPRQKVLAALSGGVLSIVQSSPSDLFEDFPEKLRAFLQQRFRIAHRLFAQRLPGLVEPAQRPDCVAPSLRFDLESDFGDPGASAGIALPGQHAGRFHGENALREIVGFCLRRIELRAERGGEGERGRERERESSYRDEPEPNRLRAPPPASPLTPCKRYFAPVDGLQGGC